MTSRADCPNCFDLEAAFGVCADQREPAPNARWEVIDAECETVAFCPSEALAGVVAAALNAAAPGPTFKLEARRSQHPQSVDPLSEQLYARIDLLQIALQDIIDHVAVNGVWARDRAEIARRDYRELCERQKVKP